MGLWGVSFLFPALGTPHYFQILWFLPRNNLGVGVWGFIPPPSLPPFPSLPSLPPPLGILFRVFVSTFHKFNYILTGVLLLDFDGSSS